MKNQITYNNKPRNFKFAEKPFIYSCDVHVYDGKEKIGFINLKYKLQAGTRKKIDNEYFEKQILNIFGHIYLYETGIFERDKSEMVFIINIYLNKEVFINYTRTEKLKNILND